MKDFILGVVSIIVALCVVAIGGEIATRAWNFSKGHLSNERNLWVTRLDDKLGWVPVSNFMSTRELVDSGGERYSVTIQTDDNGFRLFGNPLETTKKKVLFLGDSFTHAIHVSDDKTYYALLKETLDIEVFTLAAEGYGTLQEYLMLDKYIDEIRPDLIVIQYCSNDFINNSYALELLSTTNNNGRRRPYLEDEEIIYKVPSRIPLLRKFAEKYSHFLYLIISRIDRLSARPDNSVDSQENLISTQGVDYPLFKDSVDITEQLLKMIRQRVPSETPILAFSTDHLFPFTQEFKRMSGSNNIQYIESPSKALRAAENQGATTTAEDGQHWNNAGHKIVSDALKPYIQENW